MQTFQTNKGGVIKNPILGKKHVKLTDDLRDFVAKEVSSYEEAPVKTNQGFAYGSSFADSKLRKLKDKINKKPLNDEEYQEALIMLDEMGIRPNV